MRTVVTLDGVVTLSSKSASIFHRWYIVSDWDFNNHNATLNFIFLNKTTMILLYYYWVLHLSFTHQPKLLQIFANTLIFWNASKKVRWQAISNTLFSQPNERVFPLLLALLVTFSMHALRVIMYTFVCDIEINNKFE